MKTTMLRHAQGEFTALSLEQRYDNWRVYIVSKVSHEALASSDFDSLPAALVHFDRLVTCVSPLVPESMSA